jgi:hypothetical protein
MNNNYSTNYHRVQTKQLGSKLLSDEYYKIYLEINSDYFNGKKADGNYSDPIQTIDMRKVGKAHFAKRSDIDDFITNLNKYKRTYEKIKNSISNNSLSRVNANIRYDFDIPSDIDIFKMNRATNKFKYLIQSDEQAHHSMSKLMKIITILKTKETNINRIFVPFIPIDNNINLANYVPAYTSPIPGSHVWIADEKKCLDHLDNLVVSNIITKLEKGKIIHMLNHIFDQYTTDTAEIRDILESDRKRIYGITKSDVAKFLSNRNNELIKLQADYKRLSQSEDYAQLQQDCGISNCKAIYSEYADKISTSTTIQIPKSDKCEQLRKLCYFNNFNLDRLINQTIKDFDIDDEETVNKLYNMCTNELLIPFNNTIDLLDYSDSTCDNIVIEDSQIKNNIEIMFATQVNPSANSSKLMEYYSPEQYVAIMKQNVEEIFTSRQLILGDVEEIRPLKKCSKLFRSGPFYGSVVNLAYVTWSLEINKVLVACVIGKDLTFPIRIIMPEDKITIHFPFKGSQNDKTFLLGSILTRVNGDRTGNRDRFYNTFVYFERANDPPFNTISPLLVNYRGNLVRGRSYNDDIRIFYVELNMLYHSEKDLQVKLYYYGVDSTIFVSKFTRQEIYHRYLKLGFSEEKTRVITNKLSQYNLVKDTEGTFYFERIIVSGGGNGGDSDSDVTSDVDAHDNELYVKTEQVQMSIQPAYSNSTDFYMSKEIFPLSEYNIWAASLKKFYAKYGRDGEKYRTLLDPLKPFIIGKNYNINQICFPSTLSNEKLEITSHTFIDRADEKKYGIKTIVKYPMNAMLSFYLYKIIYQNNLLDINSKVLIFSKSTVPLEPVIYYNKYKLYDHTAKNVSFIFLYKYLKPDEYKFIKKCIQSYDVNYYECDKPMNNKILSMLEKDIVTQAQDLIIIEYLINIKNHSDMRAYSFQNFFSLLILSLRNCKIGGSIIAVFSIISQVFVIDFISWLSKFFVDVFLEKNTVYPVAIKLYIVFRDFKGMDESDLDKLYAINEKNYELDKTGGYNFHNNSTNDQKYLSSLVKVDNNSASILKLHSQYKQFIKDYYIECAYFIQRIDATHDRDDLIKKEINNNMLYAIEYVKSIGLELPDWITEKSIRTYFYDILYKDFFALSKNNIYRINNSVYDVKIGTYDNFTYSNKEFEIGIISSNEKIYEYIEKINSTKLKSVELIFNYYQKKLEKFLYVKYGININGKYPSRTWIKLYELYKSCDYFDNIIDSYSSKKNITIKALHICEAPGNFVNASMYYLLHNKKNTENINYDWRAQSLIDSDIYDEFGFVDKTKDKWDYGADATGNIISHDNLLYYYDKYAGIDSLIGDCGVKFTYSHDCDKLMVYQLLFAILLPKVGGNFVIKTYATIFDPYFLSLLDIAMSIYDKIYIYKSSRNIWSPEIYFVGISKNRALSESELGILFDFSKAISNGKSLFYPSNKFHYSENYEKYIPIIVENYTRIKKFFIFLVQHSYLLGLIKDELNKNIDDINIIWLAEYMGHLELVQEKYKSVW